MLVHHISYLLIYRLAQILVLYILIQLTKDSNFLYGIVFVMPNFWHVSYSVKKMFILQLCLI